MKNRFSLLLIFMFMPLFLQAFSLFEKEAPESCEGRKKYAVGEMAEAENEFSKASKRLENNAEAYYDLGNALQSQQKFEEALGAYQKSLETGKTTENLRSKIFHNMGNSLAGLGKYQDAEKFYMKSLEEEPSKESAENLEIVRRIIAQQEEQQKQQQENQDKQENQDQQDQDNQDKNQEEKDKQDENPDNEQKQQPEEQDEDKGDGNDDEQNSGMNDEDNETQDEENQNSAAEAEEQDDEQQNEDKPKESSVLKQFKQRKNLQISPFMLKKEQKSDSDQTW